jgi:recombination protein RecT
MTDAQTQTKSLTVADTIRRMEPEFKLALPSHIPSEKFTRTAITAINSNPDLTGDNIDRRSLFTAVMKAAQDGLVLDNREAAIVTFNNKNGGKSASYIPMLAGVLKKMRNSGEIGNISYGIVYKNEFEQGKFKYVKGDTELLEHNPILFGDRGPMIGIYAIVTLKDGSKVREFMDMDQINKVRNSSRSKDRGPWVDWFEEMAIKSVLKRVAKLCPTSGDIEGILREDEEEIFEAQPTNDIPEKKETRAAKLVKEKAASIVDAIEIPL